MLQSILLSRIDYTLSMHAILKERIKFLNNRLATSLNKKGSVCFVVTRYVLKSLPTP